MQVDHIPTGRIILVLILSKAKYTADKNGLCFIIKTFVAQRTLKKMP